MEEQKDILSLLDMMVQPVFCVKENIVIRANAAARQLFIQERDNVLSLLESGKEEYAAFAEGCLYLTLTLGGQRIGASLQRIQDLDVFELDQTGDSSALRAMALSAMELRKPLNNALASTAALLESQEDSDSLRQLASLNRNLYQMMRLLGNMSDAEYFTTHCYMETTDVSALFQEIFEKAESLVSHTGIRLHYESLKESIYCLADKVQLERAVLNLLSNAVKFSPKDGVISASLTRRGRTLQLTVQDSGSGISQEVSTSLFQRYLRRPGIEDSRFGLGLGLRLIQAAAAHHHGTLLVTRGENGGTRIVMTMSIRQHEGSRLRSPVFAVDYTGGFDHSLVELSDCLPTGFYDGSF